MHISSSVPAEAIAELDQSRVRAVRGPPARSVGGPAEVSLRVVEDRDRIAAGMNDIVVSRLFAAGLSLETALALMDGHPAAGRIREAIGDLDLAIRDLRDVLFDHRRLGSPSDGRPN